MDIFIRADGGEGVGMGHIMRTMVLAKKLKAHHNVTYLCSNDKKFEKGIKAIEREYINVITIERENEIEFIMNLKKGFIIVDKYDLDENYLNKLTEKFRVMYFDDNNNLEFYPVDIILNSNIHGRMLKYNTKNETKLLCGEKYCLLRDEFLKQKPISIKESIEDVVLTLGGSDDSNLTFKILEKINNKPFDIHVVIGPAFKYGDMIKAEYKNSKNILFYQTANMSTIFRKGDLAIAACGSTLYELSYLGVPTIGIIVADNQKLNAEFMKSINAIELSSIENIENITDNMTYEKRKKLNKVMTSLIDGEGVIRVVDEIEEICKI